MKKVFLLITVLLVAISVAAQSNLMSVRGISAGPGQIYVASSDVYGTTWGQCAGACTNQCMEAKQGTREECTKMCFEKCHPQPDVITKKLPPVQISQPMPVKEDCSSMCKRLASQSPISYAAVAAGFNFELFMTCMHDRCKQDCESSCRMMYGSAAQDCIQKECQPQMPQTCEGRCGLIKGDCEKTGADPEMCQKKIRDCLRTCQPQCPSCPECPPAEMPCQERCKMVADECQKAGVDEKSCQMKIRGCLRECQPQPPKKCEDGCTKIKADCTANGIDDKECEMKIRKCWRDCQSQTEYNKITECPPKNCQDNCVDGYYKCSEIAKTMKAEAGDPATVLEYYMIKCRKGVAECLDACKPSGGAAGQSRMTGVNPSIPNPREMTGLNPQPEPPMPVRETRDVSLLGRIWHIFTG